MATTKIKRGDRVRVYGVVRHGPRPALYSSDYGIRVQEATVLRLRDRKDGTGSNVKLLISSPYETRRFGYVHERQCEVIE